MAAARKELGVTYVYGGGNANGPTNGGFDCSGLTQFAVHSGTGKTIARTAAVQYTDSQCTRVAYGSHQAGDIVFFSSGGEVSHCGIVTGATTMIHAPHTGDVVKEATIYSDGRMANVQRCY